MNVSVIIPTMKGREALLKRLLDSLPDYAEKIVVDDENLLLAAKRNKGSRLAKGDWFLFIDDDNYLKESSLVYPTRDETAVMGFVACYDDKKMLIADGGSMRNYLTGFTHGLNTNNKIYKVELYGSYEVDEVANAFMVRRDVFEAAGGFDERNFPIDLDEADLCKRIKDMGYKIVMNPLAICYHKSQTYSHIPDFRRPLNAYFMGRNRVLYQRKHNHFLGYLLYLVLFMPVFVGFYSLSLLYRKKPRLIYYFLKGVFDGIFGRFKNQFQQG